MRALGAHAQPVQGVPANAEICIRKLRKLNGFEPESLYRFTTPLLLYLPTRWPVSLSHGLMAMSHGLMASWQQQPWSLGHRTLQVPSARIRQGQVPVLFRFRCQSRKN